MGLNDVPPVAEGTETRRTVAKNTANRALAGDPVADTPVAGHTVRRATVDDDGYLWADVRPEAARRLLMAALQAFSEQGYHATTTRDIATRASLSPAGVYVHFQSKEELLYLISLIGHQMSLQVLTEASTKVDEPVERLRTIVRDFAAWHARHHTVARIVNYELTALTPEHLAEVVRLRRLMNLQFRKAIRDGVDAGVFEARDLAGAALAICSLSIDVARWYIPTGRRDPDAIGDLYADLMLRMLRPCP